MTSIIDGGAETKEDYARILFSGYTGKKIIRPPTDYTSACGNSIGTWVNMDLW